MFPPRNRMMMDPESMGQSDFVGQMGGPPSDIGMQGGAGPSQQFMQSNPWGQYGSYQGFRDKWMQRGDTDINDLRNFIQGTGAQIINPKSGLVRLPSQGADDPGQILDLGIGFSKGKGRAGWTDVGLNRPQGMPTMASPSFNSPMMNMFGGAAGRGMTAGMGMQPPQGAQPLRRQMGGGRTQSFAQAAGFGAGPSAGMMNRQQGMQPRATRQAAY